ncbi:MAG: imidazole glycerol phosphate synthase subunit HisH [Candidatus Giovannonibacteria bacterium]|nr:imidazole glycerol phosphate synthase subunit HisH [Candidatus Giovannonibacteria bacterium]
MVVIIDYGMGNLFSVINALKFFNADAKISGRAEDIKSADKIILPGVGAFPDGMKNLKNLGLIGALEEAVLKNKKPFLGICLGMQLLASEGEESGLTKGLGWIAGRVRKFAVDETKFRIPHIGWNDVVVGANGVLFEGIQNPVFYFVHSYHLVPENPAVVAATCEYGEKFAAAVRKDNIFGTQFHPEKSQKSGLKLLENFLNFKI